MSVAPPSFSSKAAKAMTNGSSTASSNTFKYDRETQDLSGLKPSLNFLERYNQLVGDDIPPPMPDISKISSKKTFNYGAIESDRVPISSPDEMRRALTPKPYAGTDRSFADPRRAPSPQGIASRPLTPTPHLERTYDRPTPPRPLTPNKASTHPNFDSPRNAPKPPLRPISPAPPIDRSRSPVPPPRPPRPRTPSPPDPTRNSEYQLIKQQPAWITQARPSLIPGQKSKKSDCANDNLPPIPSLPNNAMGRKSPGLSRKFTPPSSIGRKEPTQDLNSLLSDLQSELTLADRSQSPANRFHTQSPSMQTKYDQQALD